MADLNASITADIDRKALRALVGRFRARDAARRTRVLAMLDGFQRHVIDALPMLLHSNHAAMPGFIDFEVPAGIDGYSPDSDAIAAARKLALSYTYERFKVRGTTIQSLILEPLGPSAFNVWVIALRGHHEGLEPKLTAITRHVAACELELTFKLVDALDARAGHATALGATPKLVLDDIYRTGILLAGRFPIWWLVPPPVGAEVGADYVAYCERLRQQRFVSGKDTVDLGATYRIPQKECFIAGIEGLSAALAAPLAWLPHLTLIDSYLDGFGATLADRLKLRMQSTVPDDDASEDTGLLDQVEAYLTARNETDRLDLVREAALGAGVPGARVRASRDWGFSAARLQHLGNRERWTFAQWRKEDERVTSALRVSLAKLRAAATDNGFDRAHLDPLTAALDRPRGENSINAALLPAHWAPGLVLERLADGWQLGDADGVIVAAPRLTAIAIWAHHHRLDPRNLKVGDPTQRRRFAAILGALADSAPSTAGALIIVNAEEHPSGTLSSATRTVVSNFDDALDFSGFRTNLVEAIDYVDFRPEAMTTTHYQGSVGLAAAFARALADVGAMHRCACIDTERQHAIESRVIDLIRQGQAALARSKRFAHAIGQGVAVYERLDGDISHRLSADHTEFLSRDGARLASIVFDERNERLPGHLAAAQRPPERGAYAPR